MRHELHFHRAESWGDRHDSDPPRRGFQQMIADSAKLEIIDFNVHERTWLDKYGWIVPYYIMSYMKEGSSTIRYRDREYVAHEGEVIIVPPHILHDHYMGASKHTVFLWWHFHLTIADKLDVLRFIKEPTIFTVTHRLAFEEQFLEYYNLQRQEHHTFSSHLMRRAKALEVMAYLVEGASLMNYINDSFANVPDDFLSMLSDIIKEPQTYRHMNELAARYSYDARYLANRFRHYFGTTPSKLGRQLLYEKALMLIRSLDVSMADVAYELGFSETSSFTRFFKSVEGISPGSIRKHQV